MRVDRPLLDALAEAEPETLRAIARWTARRACDAAGLSSLEWVAPALAALDRGEALPPPFDDWAQAWQRLLGKDLAVQNVHVRVENPDDFELPRASIRRRRHCRRSSPPLMQILCEQQWTPSPRPLSPSGATTRAFSKTYGKCSPRSGDLASYDQ